jgi:RNA methyltransferase, TrmH family
MITKSELKYYNSLLQKKFRNLENKFLAEGKKVVLEGLKSSYQAEIIFITQKFVQKEEEYIRLLKTFNTRIVKLKSIDFKRISETRTPEGIAAVFENKKSELNFSSLRDSILIYIEDISDPGNLGTIIRNCDWFGVKNILLSKKSAETFNPKVIRASMGSVFHLNVFEDVDIKDIEFFKESGYKYICADIEGENIFNAGKNDKIILFLSNESKGPSNELLSLMDGKVTIPGKGKAESLNVASASAVLLAELTK